MKTKEDSFVFLSKEELETTNGGIIGVDDVALLVWAGCMLGLAIYNHCKN